MFESIKFLGVIRFAATYPVLGLLFKLLQYIIPSFAAKRAAHMAFTETKLDKRLDRKTNRKDFMTYAGYFLSAILILR